MKVYGLVEVRAADDWERFVGDGHYRPGRSAYELARAWQTARGFPRSVDAVLKPLGLEPVRAFIEWPEFLDTDVGPSMTDLMIDAIEASGSPVAIGVEGKVDEPFGEKIRKWVRADKTDPTRTRVRRLEFLNEVLESDLDHDSAIYYQLLHRTASVVLRARAVGATTAVMLVHSFAPVSHDDTNFGAWSEFLAALPSAPQPARGALVGPVPLGGLKLHLAWVDG